MSDLFIKLNKEKFEERKRTKMDLILDIKKGPKLSKFVN